MTRGWVRWGPAVAWAVLLFVASARDSVAIDLASGLDKVAHFGAYLILGFLLAHATAPSSRAALIAIAVGWAYGASDELHQSTVPGRDASLGDWFADAAGTVAGVLIYLHLMRKRSPLPTRAPAAATDPSEP